MRKLSVVLLVLGFWVAGATANGEDKPASSSSEGEKPATQSSSSGGTSTPVKFKSTGEADQTLSTGYSPSDPLGSRPVNKEWDAGNPLTQQSYDENCKEDRCIRAEKRQTGTTTWQEDRASGLHVSPKTESGPPESGPSK